MNVRFWSGKDSVKSRFTSLIKEYKEVEKLNVAFINAMEFAYANQSPPAESKEKGTHYHFQKNDVDACAKSKRQLIKAIKALAERAFFYYQSLSSNPEAQKKLKDDFEPYARDMMGMEDGAYSRFDANFTGLKYLYNYPKPEERHSMNFSIEGDMIKSTYGWG